MPSYLQTSKINKSKILKEMEKAKRTTVRNYKKRWVAIRASHPLQKVQADKIDFGQAIARLNGGYRFYNVIIDVYSRYIWIDPIKSGQDGSTAESTIKLLKKIHDETGKYPETFTSDNEYKNNNTLTEFFENNNIHTHFVAPNDSEKRGTSIVERSIGTIRRMVGMWQRLNNKQKFNDNIQDIIYDYNWETVHTLLNTEPGFAMENRATFIKPRKDWKRKPKVYEYNIGDKVRLSKLIELDNHYNVLGRKKYIGYRKQNLQNYSSEIFTVIQTYKTQVDLKYKQYILPKIRKNDIIPSIFAEDEEQIEEIDYEDAVEDVRHERRINRTGVDFNDNNNDNYWEYDNKKYSLRNMLKIYDHVNDLKTKYIYLLKGDGIETGLYKLLYINNDETLQGKNQHTSTGPIKIPSSTSFKLILKHKDGSSLRHELSDDEMDINAEPVIPRVLERIINDNKEPIIPDVLNKLIQKKRCSDRTTDHR